MDDRQSIDLAAMLCSRLCHDMLSPVGALSNGLELLADEQDPQMRQRCFELLEQSARTSAAKLKFFRLAFGADQRRDDLLPPMRDAHHILAEQQHARPVGIRPPEIGLRVAARQLHCASSAACSSSSSRIWSARMTISRSSASRSADCVAAVEPVVE